jgi:glycosyltransferase involved in cell wall biosynthesis
LKPHNGPLSVLSMPGKIQSEVAQRDAEEPSSLLREIPLRDPMQRKSICIVGLGSISQNPRLVKEADALAAAGHEVVVLFLQHFEWARAMDRQILERAKWRAEIVDVSLSVAGRLRRWTSGLQLSLFRRLCRWTMRFPIAELAYSRYFLVLLRRAIRHRSDLYIGHYTGSLPVVAWAARFTGAKLAFDFEDFHRDETYPAELESLSNRLIVSLEDRYLPAASFITAASWGIADEVARTTGLRVPQTLLNVFPWSDRAKLPAPSPLSSSAVLSLYWFSQIVSLDRGLQDVIGAMALMRERAELHIRGDDSDGSIERLRRLAEERGVHKNLHFHSVVPPAELLACASVHDVGLCLEVPASTNRDVCISNKIFVYMLAGLAIVASRTRGQSDVLNAAPEIGFLYDPGNITELARILDRYATDRALLARIKAAALAAARDRWNWERESKILVADVDRLFCQSLDVPSRRPQR